MAARKKLIEVALPLDAVNAASAREKSIRHGHPSTLHLWWARRPLAAARAVIFAQMVDDPSEYVDVLLSDPKKKRAAQRALKQRAAGAAPAGRTDAADEWAALGAEAAALERERLFGIVRDLVRWENTTNEEVLERARTEIWQSWRRACAVHADHPRAAELFDRHRLPAFHDPFAGGGSLPLEAQRLGLEAHASDLNPVAVLINKAMIEVPPRFAGRSPVHPAARADATLVEKTWRGAQGLAEDVRRYGRWMRDEAEKRIGHLYPPVEVTPAMVHERPDLEPYAGRKLTVIAWLWARTVKSPNPAFADVDVPLASTFMLSTKKGKEAYVEPVIKGRGYRFTVKAGAPPDLDAAKAGTKLARGANFRCLMSGTPIAGDYIKAEGQAKRMGARLMAIVAEGDRGRIYLEPVAEHEETAGKAVPEWQPDGDVPARLTGGTCVPYGLSTWGDLFTSRQLVALTTFSDLVGEAAERVRHDATAAGLPDDRPLRDGDEVAGLPGDDRPLRDGGAGGLPNNDRPLRDGGAGAAGLPDHSRPLRAGGAGAAAYAEAVAHYEQFVKILQAAGVADPAEYDRLVQDRQRLDSEKKALESMRQDRERVDRESKSRLEDVLEARRAVSAARETFLSKTLAQNRFVRISGRRYGDDPRVIERSLRDVLNVRDDRFEDDILVMEGDRTEKGFVATLLRNLPDDAEKRSVEIEIRIEQFKRSVVAAVGGSGTFGGFFNNYLARECKRNPDLLDKLLAWFPEDGLQVEYSRHGDGTDFQPITQASAGQRAAAMLAFLLAHGEEPLVLDQPEDDLDNHLIYDLVVRRIRENKLRRQIIVVTHNPNIVVNGDAEMLHALDFVYGQCIVQQSGSLQDAAMREEVCRVMEGGREAFERRYRRLGPEPDHVR